MDKDLSMTKTLDLIFSYKQHKKIFTPLPFYRLDDLIISDRHIRAYIEQYQQGNQEYLNRVRTLSLYELSKISNEQDDQKLIQLSKRLHVLDTMLDQLNSQQFSRTFHGNLPNQPTNSKKFLPVHQFIDGGKKNTAHNKSPISSSVPVKAIKLSKSSNGQYITINGKKTYISEGQHVKVLSIDWVAIGNKLINLDIGKVIIDENENCHIRDLTGQLRSLHHGKNEWVSWKNGNIYIYKDRQLQMIPNESSITINGKQLINHHGNLCFIESNQRTSQSNSIAQVTPNSAQKGILKSVVPQDMQQEIIDILGKSTKHTIVAQRLDTIVQEVLLQAQMHNYEIHPELDWRLQSALKTLPQSVDAKEFTFHLATVEHLVNDIQMQTAQISHEHIPLIERSPALLAQAVTKYFEYLAPTEGELSLIADLARYVSDVTIGTEYLSAEVRAQRIETFWNTVNNISFKNLSNLGAEQIIDGAVYVAARATYACGVPAVISVIKDVMEGIRTASFFAERFKKAFDHVIQDNPIIITGKGTVISNASKEAVAEARQIIQAFDGMKNKPSDKQPPEIFDDTQKVVGKEQRLNDKYQNLQNKEIEALRESTKNIINELKKGEGQLIKEVHGDLMNSFNHIFHEDHIKNEIMKLGQTKESIVKRFLEIIKEADKCNKLNEDLTRIWTEINGYEVEIHTYIQKGKLLSINGFKGYSTRLQPIPVRFFI